MKALVPVAHGSESLETVTLVNILRRAGIHVVLASIENELRIRATLDIQMLADVRLSTVVRERFDLIVLPGGSRGSEALGRCPQLVELLRLQVQSGRHLAALCAAPALALAPHHLLDGLRATCYPTYRDQLPHYVEAPVVVDGTVITGAGPGSAIAFALKLVETLAGTGKAREVAAAALVDSDA
jgi:4-methyl-5(b-hydroxyethyl)-thiazole monophosphate biosynthesis